MRVWHSAIDAGYSESVRAPGHTECRTWSDRRCWFWRSGMSRSHGNHLAAGRGMLAAGRGMSAQRRADGCRRRHRRDLALASQLGPRLERGRRARMRAREALDGRSASHSVLRAEPLGIGPWEVGDVQPVEGERLFCCRQSRNDGSTIGPRLGRSDGSCGARDGVQTVRLPGLGDRQTQGPDL
jgi:hypothetical protein